ncbi:phage terminase small subunit [Halalkalibacterium halodurans]|uniref:phage terminase small subunit n=1 Tax=Halalkalibacterium halodurans TaxID=86665 RepID=UPI002E2422B5|nr:phage terminase small subunit [Halalkalibacterium halodurans]MED4086624.1 phage terminase small subunit [Halalkalibacterium halodurans]MED4104514.1 phage terminase small subunit [Halalkalibacterium halodurans]MED4110126.1 phage terminase small subunit [Halalkalibacterium halodurans]MED4149770.1 phage terminase small subunit [Halalkalibacterium halodurans]
MADKHIQAEKDYVKGMKYKEIAEKYGVSLNTVKSWKKRYGWNRDKGAPSQKSVHTKNRGAPKGNINAKGNKGGAAPERNQNAKKHGLFSKYIPRETLEIMGMLDQKDPADLIWDQIQIQYAAIIRSQQIMFVRDQEDMTKTKVEVRKGKVQGEKWEVQHAWDKQATFLQAQSRAMGELRNLIKQFNEMALEDDERRLKLEQMQASIDKIKAETKKIGDENSGSTTVVNIIDRWGDDSES